MGENTCVCCGASIPEGGQVCPTCLSKVNAFNGVGGKGNENFVIRNNITGAYLLKNHKQMICFGSRQEAWDYIKSNNLNQQYFDIVKSK